MRLTRLACIELQETSGGLADEQASFGIQSADLDHDLPPCHWDDSARHIATKIGCEEYLSP